MKKNKILTQPARLSELTFDELYEDIADNWQLKAERLRNRRWRKLRQQMV